MRVIAGVAIMGTVLAAVLFVPSPSCASLPPLSDKPEPSTPGAPESEPFAADRKLFNIKSFQIEEEIIRQTGVFTASEAFFTKSESGEKRITRIEVRIYLTPEQWERHDPLLERRVLSFFQEVYPSPPIQYTVRALRATLDAEVMKKKRQKYAEKNLRVYDLSGGKE